MPLVVWTDGMSVGVKAMDDDHRKLLDLVNELSDGMVSGNDRAALGEVLERLIQHTKEHLAREERLFAQVDYPQSKSHYVGHDLMIAKALGAQAAFRCGSTSVPSEEIMAFLQEWLAHHTEGLDKDYGPYLNKHGIY